jgi:hypothetical protein
MHMTISYAPSIDDILGDRQKRFFGRGYLKNTQMVSRARPLSDGDSRSFIWHATVMMPEDWSSKNGIVQKPHLTTIDVIELSLSCLRSIAGDHIPWMEDPDSAVRELQIIAGKTPFDAELSGFEIRGDLNGETETSCRLSLQIANMQVELTLADDRSGTRDLEFPGKQDLAITRVLVHAEPEPNTRAIGAALMEPETPRNLDGWSLASCFVATLQVGQALLYSLDNIDRSQTNTLWMKRTRFERLGTLPAFDTRQPIHVELENVRRYSKDDGDWRRADIVGFAAGRRIVCSVTHKLPEGV